DDVHLVTALHEAGGEPLGEARRTVDVRCERVAADEDLQGTSGSQGGCCLSVALGLRRQKPARWGARHSTGACEVRREDGPLPAHPDPAPVRWWHASDLVG